MATLALTACACAFGAAVYVAGDRVALAQSATPAVARPARSFLDTAAAAEMIELAETRERIAAATSGARVRR